MPAPGQPLDTAGSTKYPVIVSERLLKGDGGDYSYTSIQLNHEPKLSSGAKMMITASRSGGDNCDLTISGQVGNERYVYAGSQSGGTSCVLIFNPETQTFTLDALDSEFNFNARATPDNRNAKSLAATLPQLETTAPDPSSSEESLFDEEEFSEGDPDNPYDYRHYLKRRHTSSPDPMDSFDLLDSAPPSPPRREARPSKPRPTRRSPTPPREETDADNEDSSDDGGISSVLEIITDGAIEKPKSRFRSAGANRNNQTPISFRSAANSASPAQHSSSEESDEDMEDVGPPASAQKPVEQLEASEDEFQAELMRELEMAEAEAEGDEEGGGVAVQQYMAESSEESEED